MNAVSGKFLVQPGAGLALRILVVDDDRNTREILFEALQLFGAEARCVSSVAQARKMLAAWHADVLVSDLGMPDEDGYDLIREIRNHPLDGEASMPAIALTGYTRAQDQQRAIGAGYNEVLTKPAELDALLEAIRRVASADPRRP
ncbi:MAG: CheY chemotaxis protein or a CheY-like [Betaproteobacteria bacterium]|nr:CheY chemotaxis protein or a CheY-like [Betaproteobacteria bacterium]